MERNLKMADVVRFPPPEGPRSIIGPPLSGNRVIVEARVIPRMRAHDTDAGIEIILDGRFSITISKDDAYPVAWMIAQALAIGQGYPSLNAPNKDCPFAPEYYVVDSPLFEPPEER
jgi:hypothetical protein